MLPLAPLVTLSTNFKPLSTDEYFGWPRRYHHDELARHQRCQRTILGAPQVGCFSRCSHYTPCLVRTSPPSYAAWRRSLEAPQKSTSAGGCTDNRYACGDGVRVLELSNAGIAAAWSDGPAGFAQLLGKYNKQLLGRLKQGKLALRVTGPLSDGFWMRVTVVLAHARWARAAGLPVSVVYRSPHDNYDDATSAEDGWQQYFEDVRGAWPHKDQVQASCSSAALIFKYAAARDQNRTYRSSGAYAWSWADVVEQRRWRREVASELPLRPRAKFVEAATRFWAAHGIDRGDHATKVLGLHLRGTDRICRVEPQHYLSLIRAYLCRWPNARIFAASDDARLLEALRAVLRRIAVSPPSPGNASDRLITRTGVVRGRSRSIGKGLNPGVHAREMPSWVSNMVLSELHEARLPTHNASHAAQLGADVLTDTLLLSQCDYLLGSTSAVTSYAILLGPERLHGHSFLWDVLGHPAPKWADACTEPSPVTERKVTGNWDHAVMTEEQYSELLARRRVNRTGRFSSVLSQIRHEIRT